jgi:hypothetical protein
MADILHRVGVKGPAPEKVYDALTTLDGLSGRWLEKTSGNPGLGGVIENPIGLDMKVTELAPGRLVRWEATGGPAECGRHQHPVRPAPARRLDDRLVQAGGLA